LVGDSFLTFYEGVILTKNKTSFSCWVIWSGDFNNDLDNGYPDTSCIFDIFAWWFDVSLFIPISACISTDIKVMFVFI